MTGQDMLPSPFTKKTLPKAPRGGHPSEPHAEPPAMDAARVPAASANRVGPNRVRKSLYLPTDIADRLSELAAQIHFDSRGRISKAEAAGELIRFGLENVGEVYARFGMS